MKIVIDIPEEYYSFIKNHQYMDRYYVTSEASKIFCAIKHGTPLPDGAEILTKEAYSDLCMRAANAQNFESEEYVDDRIKNYDKMLKSGILDCVIEEVTGKRGTANNE